MYGVKSKNLRDSDLAHFLEDETNMKIPLEIKLPLSSAISVTVWPSLLKIVKSSSTHSLLSKTLNASMMSFDGLFLASIWWGCSPWKMKKWNNLCVIFFTLYLVQLIKHPILRIPNVLFVYFLSISSR